MWSFVHDKSQQYWLWWAVDHRTGVPLAYCFGTREHKHLDELRTLLAPFHIDKIYADDNYAYKKHITESTVVTGKRNTQRIERNHLSLRTWCSRLVRKGIRFSKLHLMHRIVIGLIIRPVRKPSEKMLKIKDATNKRGAQSELFTLIAIA